MAGFVIDRRNEHRDKSSTSRDRFLKRYKDVIKRAAADSVRQGKGFRDLTGGKDGQQHEVTIDRKSLDEPHFGHGKGGNYEFVLGGNNEYIVGDMIPKPPDDGRRGDASPDGDGEDSFTFYLDREEFIRLILDDLALPDLVKKNLVFSVIAELVHAGFTKQGSPGNMDVMRSFKQSLSRRIGLHRAERKAKLLELQAQLALLEEENEDAVVRCLMREIVALKAKLRAMPFFDPNNDIRYRHWEMEKKPSVSAVMFALMDVSGSMTENMKMHAKYFFLLLHLFLKRNYNNVDVIFIRHTTVAEEVDEETFFYDRETGGTIVSSGLQKILDVIKERYDPTVWNIYVAQASDGDNYGADSGRCQSILQENLLLLAQYMVYVEMSDGMMDYYRQHGFAGDSVSDLWKCYETVAGHHDNFKMKTIGNKADIYPVFRELFEKKVSHTQAAA